MCAYQSCISADEEFQIDQSAFDHGIGYIEMNRWTCTLLLIGLGTVSSHIPSLHQKCVALE
jgi:hypothetical protein